MRIKDLGEIGLIREFAKGLRLDTSVVKGIGDDTAVVRWARDKYLLLTCDMLIEDVHFTRRTATPYQIGWKAMARNVSDIAAMGGVPRYALVSCAIDPALPVSFARELKRGMSACAGRFGVSIVGGDTARSRKLVIDISLVGKVEKKCLVLRSGAQEGDLILVTGTIGGSGAGKHLDFMPRLAESRMLVQGYRLNAMIDVSDGLFLDLSRILDASGKGARVFKNAVPLTPGVVSFEKAVSEGEDFELLFTMSIAEARRFFRKGLARMRTPVTLIGAVTDRRSGFVVSTEKGERRIRVSGAGFTHF